MTLMALVVAVTAGAQGTTIHEYPWNPDWNNDNYIGSQDLTGFLLPLEVSLVIRLSLVIMMGRLWRMLLAYTMDIVLIQFSLNMSLKMFQPITSLAVLTQYRHIYLSNSDDALTTLVDIA